MVFSILILQNSSICDLYGRVREKWPYLSEKYFRLSNGVKEISPDCSGRTQLDGWDLNLHDNSRIVVTFATVGGVIIVQLHDVNVNL